VGGEASGADEVQGGIATTTKTTDKRTMTTVTYTSVRGCAVPRFSYEPTKAGVWDD
jgi:hypothetical protein